MKVFFTSFKIFVSFHKGDFVRGVSGSFKKVDICYLGIVKRVFSAAFSDNRFSPLKPEELEGLQVVVVFLEDSIMDSVVIEAVL